MLLFYFILGSHTHILSLLHATYDLFACLPFHFYSLFFCFPCPAKTFFANIFNWWQLQSPSTTIPSILLFLFFFVYSFFHYLIHPSHISLFFFHFLLATSTMILHIFLPFFLPSFSNFPLSATPTTNNKPLIFPFFVTNING